MNFIQAMKEQRKSNKDALSQIRELEPLFPIALEHAEKIATSDHSYTARFTMINVNWFSKRTLDMHIYLGETDKIKDILPFIDEMIKDKRLDYTDPLSPTMEDTDQMSCTFKLKGQEDYHSQMTVYIRADHSKACKQVGTGKYKEIFKTVCEDI